MISRLLRTVGALFAYFCVATILSQVILLSYLAMRWKIDQEKMHQMVAIAQGVDLLEIREQAKRDREIVSNEQVAFDQIIETRAVKVRDIELREQALKQGLEQLAYQEEGLSTAVAKQEMIQTAFTEQLASLRDGAEATGLENARAKLESLKPVQAKQQLTQMLENDELDDVVQLLAAMTDSKASKIMAEFKGPGEEEQLYEILRRIREGYPESELVANTQNQLSQN